MLIPDCIHPEQTVYYNGAVVLRVLQEEKSFEILNLYSATRAEHEMTLQVFLLCLDWLYLIGVVQLNGLGGVELCS